MYVKRIEKDGYDLLQVPHGNRIIGIMLWKSGEIEGIGIADQGTEVTRILSILAWKIYVGMYRNLDEDWKDIQEFLACRGEAFLELMTILRETSTEIGSNFDAFEEDIWECSKHTS